MLKMNGLYIKARSDTDGASVGTMEFRRTCISRESDQTSRYFRHPYVISQDIDMEVFAVGVGSELSVIPGIVRNKR